MNGTKIVLNKSEKINQKSRNGHLNHINGEHKPEGRVLVIYTGGTIGMIRNAQGGKNFFQN